MDAFLLDEDELAIQRKAQLAFELEVDDLKWLMGCERGRRVMWGLLSFTGVFRQPYTGDKDTFFRCGMMNVGQRYLSDIHEHCPEQYHQMVIERLRKDD